MTGSFTLEQNASITVNGGSGSSHYDGSGAGGSGGAVRIEAPSITNFGSIEAKGGDALGSGTLAGAGGGGRIAFFRRGRLLKVIPIQVEDGISQCPSQTTGLMI